MPFASSSRLSSSTALVLYSGAPSRSAATASPKTPGRCDGCGPSGQPSPTSTRMARHPSRRARGRSRLQRSIGTSPELSEKHPEARVSTTVSTQSARSEPDEPEVVDAQQSIFCTTAGPPFRSAKASMLTVSRATLPQNRRSSTSLQPATRKGCWCRPAHTAQPGSPAAQPSRRSAASHGPTPWADTLRSRAASTRWKKASTTSTSGAPSSSAVPQWPAPCVSSVQNFFFGFGRRRKKEVCTYTTQPARSQGSRQRRDASRPRSSGRRRC